MFQSTSQQFLSEQQAGSAEDYLLKQCRIVEDVWWLRMQVKLIKIQSNKEGASVYLRTVARLRFLSKRRFLPNCFCTISTHAMYTEPAFVSERQDILSVDLGYQWAI